MKLNVPTSAEALSLCIDKPYFIFEWDDVLPEEIYRQLLAEFPGTDGKGYKSQDAGTLYVNDRQDAFHQFLARSKVWQDFFTAWRCQDLFELIHAWQVSATMEADKAQQAEPKAKAQAIPGDILATGLHRGREMALRQAAQELRALIDGPADLSALRVMRARRGAA